MEIKLIKSCNIPGNDVATMGTVTNKDKSGTLVVISPIALLTERDKINGYANELLEHLKLHAELYKAVCNDLGYSSPMGLGWICYDVLYIPGYITEYLKKEWIQVWLTTTLPTRVKDDTWQPSFTEAPAKPSLITPTDLGALGEAAAACTKAEAGLLTDRKEVEKYHLRVTGNSTVSAFIEDIPLYVRPSENILKLHRFMHDLTKCIHNSLKDEDFSFHDTYSFLVSKHKYHVAEVYTYDSGLNFEVYNDSYNVKVDIDHAKNVNAVVRDLLDGNNSSVLTTSEKLLTWIPLGI